jgi:hypothetical protein
MRTVNDKRITNNRREIKRMTSMCVICRRMGFLSGHSTVKGEIGIAARTLQHQYVLI